MAAQSGKHTNRITFGTLCLLGMLLLTSGLHGQNNFNSLLDNAKQALNAGRLEDAIQLANQASQIKPGDPEPYNTAGNAWYNKNEFRKALELYNAALQADPGFKFAYLNRGLCYYKLADTAKAMHDYQKVVQLDPNYSLAYNNMGLIFYDRGSTGYAQALELFSTAIAKDASNKYPYYNKGRVYVNTGRYDDAIRELSAAIKLDSNYTEVYERLGSAYSSKEDYQSAIWNYSKAMRLDPKNPFYVRNRGYCYEKIQNDESALEDFDLALTLDPKYADAYNDRGNIYFGRQYRDSTNIQRAMDNYSKATQFNPKLIYPYYNRGLLEYNRNNFGNAVREFTQALSIDSNYLDAPYRRGLAYFFLQDYAHALNDFNRTIRNNPRHENAYYYQGLTYLRMKSYGKAIESYNKALSINNRNIDVLIEKGYAYYYGSKPDESMEIFNRILQLNPDNVFAWNGLGLVNLYKGKYADAVRDFTTCLRINPKFGNGSANLVVTLLADNQFNSAFTVYNDYKNRNLDGFISNTKFQFVSTYIQACVYHFRTGNYDNAANLLRSALQEYDSFKNLDYYDHISGQKIQGNIYAKLGLIQEMKGKLPDAMNLYKQGKEINPFMPEAKTGYTSQFNGPMNIAELISPTVKTEKGNTNSSGAINIPTLESGSAMARFHALLIAEEDYDNYQFAKLRKPVEDATRLRDILVNRYNFDPSKVTVLKNGDRKSILFSLNNLLKDKNENDNVLIFYAGHGTCDKNDRGEVIEGYWVPLGAAKGQTENYVSGSEIRVALTKSSAKHVVVISDACFSGSLSRDAGVDDAPGHIQQLFQKTSRQLLASGDLVPVPDNSVFLVYLLKELENNTDPYLTVSDLWSRVQKIVSNNSSTNPICIPFRDTGDELGQFVLIRKK